jgi:hypothetical protein
MWSVMVVLTTSLSRIIAKRLFSNIVPSIRLLVKLNDGIECRISHTVPYTEFVKRLQPHERNKSALQRRPDDLIAEHPPMIQFVLQSEGVDRTS